jgi:hypothetical protein
MTTIINQYENPSDYTMEMFMYADADVRGDYFAYKRLLHRDIYQWRRILLRTIGLLPARRVLTLLNTLILEQAQMMFPQSHYSGQYYNFSRLDNAVLHFQLTPLE